MSENNNVEVVEEKVFCRKCGTELSKGQTFCAKCGTPVKRICSNCQTELNDDQEFCPNCGAKYSDKLRTIDVQNASKNVSNVIASKKKTIIIALIALVVIIGGLFGYKALTKPNFEKIVDEYCKSKKDDDGNEYSFYREYLYGQNGITAAMKIGKNGDWIKLDTNPNNIDDFADEEASLSFIYYVVVHGLDNNGLNEVLLEKLGFSDVVIEQQLKTTWSMGVQTAESNIATAEWTYHPDKGFEVTYKLK